MAAKPVPILRNASPTAFGFFKTVSIIGLIAFPSFVAPSTRLPNASGTHPVNAGITLSVVNCARLRNGSSMASYVCNCISSKALFIFAISPVRLSFMVSAISCAAPVDPLRASSYPATLSMPSFRTIFTALIESSVNVALKAAALCAFPIPSVALSTSVKISVRSRKLPEASCTATEVSPIFIAPSSIFAVMSRITAARDVPASDPFRP